MPLAFYANIRLDSKQPEEIIYHNDIRWFNNSVRSHWPNRSLGFSDSNTGSDVLKAIENFLNNTVVPVCGSIIHISLKRYPNERDIERLVDKIRQSHAVVTVVIPTSSSGGLYSETMYDLASKTNGLGFFATDDGYTEAEDYNNYWNPIPFFTYSANVNLSGSGSLTLPNLSLPYGSWNRMFATLQDFGVLSSFQNMSLNFQSSTDSFSLIPKNGVLEKDSNFITGSHNFYVENYTVTLDYNYSDSKQQILQIRMYTGYNIDYWIPYAN